MPTENEYKFILSATAGVNQELVRQAACRQEIRQGYLAFARGMTARVRHILQDGKKPQWIYTFKQKVAKRVVEVEKKLDERDGADLWDVSIGRLFKTRYIVPDPSGEGKWDVDFFLDQGRQYFAMAEAELPEGAPRPRLLPLLKPWLVYEVPTDDDRFSNKRLGDVAYAERLYQKLVG